MKVIICDDERIYVEEIRKNIESFLKDKGFSAEIDIYTDASKVSQNFYDIAFLDIEMGEIKGTEIATELKKINPYIVIFIITSYEQYLDEAMDLDVFRYIKKPLDIKRLFDGMDKALRILDSVSIEFYLKNNGQRKKVFSTDIIYIEIVGRTTKVVTVNGEYFSENKMSFWAEKLSAMYFYQVHTSFLINMKYITTYVRNYIILDNRFEIPIACRKRTLFRQYFIKHSGGN